MYYLPIYINNRRMHIVKLNRVTHNYNNQTLFAFLVDASNNYDVFSLPSEYIQLICDENENIDLTEATFTLEENRINDNDILYRHSKGLPIYTINISLNNICKDNSDSLHKDNSDSFRFTGKLGDTIGQEPFTLKALQGTKRATEYILEFRYVTKDQFGRDDIFVGAIRICEYTESKKTFYASLDFGSEASQIHKSTDNTNMNLRDAFKNIVKGEGKEKDIDYWQGRKEEDVTLYKSIFHIHQEPARTEFGDLPMNNGNDTFLKSLLRINASTENHILLPNLKLIELQPGIIPPTDITFSHGSFWGEEQIKVSLTNLELNDFILRQILCNFLAVTLKSEHNKNFIHFMLLVPNVYSQEKVHKIITGLYDDFNILRGKDIFSQYKGIEISIVSESDASFFGVRTKIQRGQLPWIKGAHYLIIDAGKGTTDFSLLAQEGQDLSNYSSIYRSGIPASGHVLTYAFYEAVRSFFHRLNIGDFFDQIMRNSVGKETADVLNFVSLLEQFKIKSENFEEDSSINEKALELERHMNNSLSQLNNFLAQVLSEGKLIPGMKEALKNKIKIMTDLIKDSIVAYTKNQNIVCDNIFLTGRAFMLKQFKENVSAMLIENGIVKSKDNIFYNDLLTKSICTYGAMVAKDQCTVNKNSNMLGCPSLTEEFGTGKNKNQFKKLIHIIRKKKGVKVDMSFDFFYRGLGLSNAKNAIFSLSGVENKVGNGISNDITIYYVGDGYICKYGNICTKIAPGSTIPQIDAEILIELVKESIFPFGIQSFGLDDKPQEFNSKKESYTPQIIKSHSDEQLFNLDDDPTTDR